MIRVLLVDDEALVRTGFRLILGEAGDIDVVGEASNGREAVQQSHHLSPDVILMDVRMPVEDGIAATAEICRAHEPGTGPRIIILTTFDLDEYVDAALRAGASGFLLKDALSADLISGVRTVASGEAILAPAVTHRLIGRFLSRPVPVPVNPNEILRELTPREVEVFNLIALGKSNAEIGAHLFLSEGTVKAHVSRILGKLDLRDRVQAVILAYDSGLIQSRTSGEETSRPPSG